MKRSHEVLASVTALALAAGVIAVGNSGVKGQGHPVAVSRNDSSLLLFNDSHSRHHTMTSACSTFPGAHVSAFVDTLSKTATEVHMLGNKTPPFPEKPSEADLAVVAQVVDGQLVEVVVETDEPGTSTIIATDLASFSTVLHDKFGYPVRMMVEQTADDRQMITLGCI